MQTMHNRQPSKTKRRILGMILRLRREDCGLRQGEVARAIGISQSNLSKLERGQLADVKLFQHLIPLADLYGVDIESLLRYGDLKV